MPQQMRANIVRLISDELRRNGPLRLTNLPELLRRGGIPQSVYASPKRWLEANFPEFFVFGTQGYSTVDFAQSPLSKFYRLLNERVPAGAGSTPVSVTLVRSLIRQAGLFPEGGTSVESLRELLKVYPCYELWDGSVLVSAPVPAAAPVVSAPELQYIHGITYMNWKMVYNKISRYNSDISMESMRNQVVRRFARALLDGEGLLLDAVHDELPRIVLDTGCRTDADKGIYCVLQPNERDKTRQAWMLSGVVYPGEPDEEGLGAWLEKKFFAKGGISYQTLQEQIRELSELRAALLPVMAEFLRSLECGLCPAPVSERIAHYESLWDALWEGVEQFPALDMGRSMPLEAMTGLLEEKNELMDMAKGAVALFDRVYYETAERLERLQAVPSAEDLETIHGLFVSADVQGDIETFREILRPYICLKEVLHSDDRGAVRSQIAAVADHFGLDKLDILDYLLGAYGPRYEFLEALEEIRQGLEACLRAAAQKEAPQEEAVDTDVLAREILTPGAFDSSRWISVYHGLMPQEERLRSAVLAEQEPGGSLTPGGIAARLLAVCGNQDRLAERYLLLGLITDRKACVPRLLALYRENQAEEDFLRLWESEYRGAEFTVQDACCWLSIRCKDDTICWNEIEEFVSGHPEIKNSPEYKKAMRRMAQGQEHPVAYQRWIGMNDVDLNPLEAAVAANDMDAVYLLLENGEQMQALGYDSEELAGIRQALDTTLPGGVDVYSKAARLYRVQKNKNSSAESLLWSAPQTPAALRLLFDIYSQAQDHGSLCWLTQTFSVPVDTMARTAAYAAALSHCEQYDVLLELLPEHPELWHRHELLQGLEESPWVEIRQREAADPIREITAFEQALIRDDTDAMRALLAQPEQMEGYPAELLQTMSVLLEEGKAPAGTDRVSVVKRFKYYQGNLRRGLERYLYREFDANTNWAVQHLYALAFAQEHWLDAAHYFEAYPLLARTDSNLCMYMWCLLRLGRTEQLFDQAQHHPECLREDSALVQAIMALAEGEELQEYSHSIQRMITLLPRNAFENAVMQSDHAQMQKYVSDPDLLADLGYSAESIARFKDRISKPMPYGSDGYPLAFRMRLYFGNERAIPFLQDAQEDERAAKLLLDIYFSMERWPEVCRLYRKNLPKDIWNSTFEQRYVEALSQSHDREDCRLYLEYLQSEKNTDRTGTQYQWKYLHSLVGTRQEEAALEQMQQLLEGDYGCSLDVALDTFDLVWETGSQALRRQSALFAARMYLKHMDTMPLDQQKAMLSLNGNLLEEEDAEGWIDLFREHGLERIATFLMCYFNYGIGSDAESLRTAADALFALLSSEDEQYESGILTAVTQFALENGLWEDPEKNRLLISHWLQLVLSRNQDSGLLKLENLSDTEFAAFGEFWKTVELTPEQKQTVLAACLADSEQGGEWTGVFFRRVPCLLSGTWDDSEESAGYSDILLGAFRSWFAAIGEEDTEAVKVAAQFLAGTDFRYGQMKDFVTGCADCAALYEPQIRDVLLARCEHVWPDIQYSYLQALYFSTELAERRQEAVSQAQQLLYTQRIEIEPDSASLQFAYSIVCRNPSPENLHFLYELYSKAGKTGHADILLHLEAANGGSEYTHTLHSWFRRLLENNTVEWIEYHSKWWAPLVSLREEDNQTKRILAYLLSDDEASVQHKDSLLRLLLSDLDNSTYIGCYLRTEKELPAAAYTKLVYIRAQKDPGTCVEATRACIAREQYLFALRLLMTENRASAANSEYAGVTLGKIFTEESVKRCPELAGEVPGVFRFIIKINRADTAGAWKNIGRAVDIAILTQREGLFFDIFNEEYQNMYFTYSGKCAALMANLLLRGELEQAAHYMQECHERNSSDPYLYMALLSAVIDDCRQTGVLSPENDILVRSIPISGNMRPLELYGSLVRYAMENQQVKACARAFYRLRSYTAQDKALLACCLQLYTAVAEEYGLQELYTVAREYMELVQDETMIVRMGKVLAVIAACAPEEITHNQLFSDCEGRIQDSAVLAEIMRLKREYTRFLEGGEEEGRRRFLLRAATGWWQLDEQTVGYLADLRALSARQEDEQRDSLDAKLMELYPSAFFGACIAAVLRRRSEPDFCESVRRLLEQQGNTWAWEQLTAAADYPEALCQQIAGLTDAPIDLPGLYSSLLSVAFRETDDDRFGEAMSLLLAVQRNFAIKEYNGNVCGLKDMTLADSAARQHIVSRMILKKTVHASDDYQLPQEYIKAGAYEMAIVAAEKQLEREQNYFGMNFNQVCLDLGRFMTEPIASRKYALGQLMNMATLLCQYGTYGDMDRLLEACPAKWKLCLRSAQEFVQGNPANVLYLLGNPAFQTHDGCYMFVYTLAERYLSTQSARWQNALRMERDRFGRGQNRRIYDLSTVPAPRARCSGFLLRSSSRNPAKLPEYKDFVNQYVAEMKREDKATRTSAPRDRSSDDTREITLLETEGITADVLWKLPFIAERLERSQPKETQEGGAELTQSGEESTEEQQEKKSAERAALVRKLKGLHNDAEIIEVCSKLLVFLRQESITNTTREYCVTLGLAMYREKCEHRGMATYATEEAREILYSMVPLMEGLTSMPGLGASMKTYVRQCLESYRTLAQFTTDCMSDTLLKLCSIVARDDRNAAKHLKDHILFAREIGQKMRMPMTNVELLKFLQDCINQCRSSDSLVDKQARDVLTELLNQEIRAFRNKAQVYLRVYNSESVTGNACLFGKVENLGGEKVTSLTLSLSVGGVFVQQCTLPALAGSEMVPFALSCGDECEGESLSYKLMLKYVAQDGAEETAQPVEGVLTLKDPSQIRNSYQYYDASNPADSDNYIERESISITLEANYLVDGGFRRFPNFAIYGMKRSGKSSVLRRLGRLFDENYTDGVRHVIVSCEGITGNFYTRAHSVFVKYVLDELNFKFDFPNVDDWEEFCAKWENPPESITDFRWLDSFYTALSRQWLPDTGLVIMVDEIERLYFELGEDDGYLSVDADGFIPRGVDSSNAQAVLWDVINKMTQRDRSPVRFVLCGSDFFTSKIIAEGDNLTQFFQKGVKLNVDRMEYEEIRDALRANASVTLHPDTVDYLWDIANGLPWHSKIFCNSVIENQLIRREAGKRTTIYPSDIQDAIDRILSTTKDIASPANFGLLSLNAEETLIIRVAAEALETRLARISQEDLLERLHQAGEDPSKDELYMKALLSLVNERKLLKPDKGRNYQFGCELYRMYLRHELPSRFL